MNSRIPLPTDNIYKFYALFGMLLLVFAIGSVTFVTKSTNEFMAIAYVDLEDLRTRDILKPREEMRRKILERQIEVAEKDKRFFFWSAMALAAFGSLAMLIGFTRWHSRIQPVLDEIAELQLAKLRHEVTQQKVVESTIRRLKRPR